MKSGLVLASLLLAALGLATWWALESGGVAVVETRTPDGTTRSTHVWYVEPDGELWLEAGSPENSWFRDLHATALLRFRADARAAHYVARIVEGPSAHQRIRSLIRKKYGLRDRWVGLFVDTSRSVAVQLLPLEEPARALGAGVGKAW
jgi:hypothetical protein